MTTAEFLDQLRTHDVRVWVEGDRVRCSAPNGRMTTELQAELAARKEEIILFFRELSTVAGVDLQSPPLRRVSRDAELPLSFAQRRLWFLDRLQPGNPAYNLGASRYIRGFVDLAVMEKSIGEVVKRHEALRTIFPDVAGAPVQVILPFEPLHLNLIDLTQLGDDQVWQEVDRLKKEEAQLPFDLGAGPLIRTTLLRVRPQEQVLLFTLHHIIADGWSLGVFLKEVTVLYQNFLVGRPPSLPELPVQYVDYSVWQRECLNGAELDRLLGYWIPKLRGSEPVIALPTDHPRRAVQTNQGAALTFTLPAELSEKLRGLSRRETVTLFMTLLAIFNALLFRYSGQTDILVGTPLANRPRPELEDLIGLFVSTLVLRTDLSGEPTARELIHRVREVVLEAQAHEDLPFEKLVETLRPERTMAYTPIFQVAFILQNTPLSSEFEVTTAAAMYDLTLFMWDEPNGIRGTFEFNLDLFDSDTISRMRDHFQALVEGIVADPQQSVTRLPLLTGRENQKILVEWNATETSYPRDRCVHQVFEAQVGQSPDAIAAESADPAREILGDPNITYRELDQRANQLARRLQKAGVHAEVPVGLCLDRSIGALVALLGILKAGGAYVPLDRTNPKERLANILEDARIRVILTQRSLVGQLPKMAAEVIVLDETWDSLATESADPLPCDVRPENLAYIMFTSGSTGRPKGVCVTHRNVVRLVKDTNFVNFETRGAILHFAPLAFDASTFEIWGGLLNGIRLVPYPAQVPSAGDLAQVLRQHRITMLWLTAGLFHQMAENELDALCSVPQLLAGGDVLSLSHVQKVQSSMGAGHLINGYGPTENTTFTCCFPMTAATKLENSVPIGRAISNTRVYILDRHLQPVPIGVIGELYAGGDGVARGYLGLEELTAARFLPDPFYPREGARMYRTGDLARFRADGNIEFVGRVDAQVKIRGFRIELEEIESALSQHPAIRAAVVDVHTDGSWIKSLVAYYSPREPVAIAASDLRHFLLEKLPEYMVPSAFVMLETFPLTPNGKVDRRALPAPEHLLLGRLEPRTVLETQLLMIWEQVLGVSGVSVRDNFFDLGGHSLLAVKIFAQVEKVLGKRLPPSTLFQAPTIEELAANLSKEGFKSPWASLVAIQPGGTKPPVFAIPGLGGNVVGYSELAQLLGREQPLYGLQSRGLDGKEKPFEHIEDIATHYLTEIQAVDPDGPYYLIGACMGGAIAYEIAQQLRAQDKEVAFLALLETWPPARPGILGDSAARLYEHFSFLGEGVARHFKELIKLSPVKWARYLIEKRKIVTEMISKRDIYRGDSWAMYRDRVSAANHRAISRYAPRPYKGRVSLFLASARQVAASRDPRLEWGRLAAGGQAVFRVFARDSGLLLKSPHVEVLAEQLKACLEQARSEFEPEDAGK
ncbi:MAG: amino acid adenylation domain-containing protein [Candidatus Acidiferrales bacterium]